MVDVNIFREQNADEKKEFQPIGKKTFQDVARQHLISIEKEQVKKHLPFCYRCAKMDLQDLIDKKMIETVRSESKLVETSPKIELEKIDFVQKYGEKNFEMLGSSEVIEKKLLDGIRAPVKTGYQYEYKCKKRGCWCSVFVPLSEHEKRQKKKG